MPFYYGRLYFVVHNVRKAARHRDNESLLCGPIKYPHISLSTIDGGRSHLGCPVFPIFSIYRHSLVHWQLPVREVHGWLILGKELCFSVMRSIYNLIILSLKLELRHDGCLRIMQKTEQRLTCHIQSWFSQTNMSYRYMFHIWGHSYILFNGLY